MRPSAEEWAMSMALVTAQRSTCVRRHVGCVLLNHRGHVLATGYNGVPSGFDHCNEGHQCPGGFAKSGEDLDKCFAVHAEVNALLQCHDVYQIDTAYTTTSPCMACCKLLLNTSCKRIVFIEEYAHTASKELWESAGRLWIAAPRLLGGQRGIK